MVQSLIVGLITLLLFELSFRIYIIDFYAGTFDALNDHMKSREEQPTILIVGDSFSAFPNGYVQVLHDSLPEYRVRNISVPGTSIIEQYLFGRHHTKREQPDIIVFQFYVGNDFLGWRHKLNWKDLPVARNIYWRLSEHVWSLGYLNRQLGRFASARRTRNITEFIESPFNPDLYTSRDKYYFKSEPGLVENTAYLRGGRESDFEPYAERIQDLFDHASEDTQIFFLIIPHCSQVTEEYLHRAERIGGEFSVQFEMGEAHYPLYSQFVKKFESDRRVKVLNPISYMKQEEEMGNRLYFNNDSHLNHEGQKKLGEYVLDVIANDDGIRK